MKIPTNIKANTKSGKAHADEMHRHMKQTAGYGGHVEAGGVTGSGTSAMSAGDYTGTGYTTNAAGTTCDSDHGPE